jgi:putative hydrolase of the HAD superfamily
MKNYKHIFFDLDNTLWDFDRNSAEVLHELYSKYNLNKHGIESVELFVEKYRERNVILWDEYRFGKIDKETLRGKRFEFTFWDMGITVDDTVVKNLSADYMSITPSKEHLFPEVADVLSYLEKKYFLHIITNGFHDVQHIKLKATDIRKFFRQVIISEHTGFRKPDVNIFYFAQEEVKAQTEECIMIGDGLDIDIAGARKAGWDTVFFNPRGIKHEQSVTHEIEHFSALKNFL